MKKIPTYLTLLLLTACTPDKKGIETTDTRDTLIVTRLPTAPDETIADSVAHEKTDDGDCVFNNDYKGLTTEWLKELNKNNFIWRADLDQALIPIGQDTVFISKGGCTHFGLLVELKLMNDQHMINDSTFWIQKTLQLANDYKMDHYAKMIKDGKIRIVQSGETKVWFEVDDNDTDDNLYYDGIEITFEEDAKKIGISQYLN